MKNEIIKLRVTQKEKEIIRQKATRLNLTMSKFVRQMALHGKVYDYSELAKLNHEIKKIGNNINQCVKLMYTYFDYSDTDYHYILREFNELRNLIEKHMGISR